MPMYTKSRTRLGSKATTQVLPKSMNKIGSASWKTVVERLFCGPKLPGDACFPFNHQLGSLKLTWGVSAARTTFTTPLGSCLLETSKMVRGWGWFLTWWLVDWTPMLIRVSESNGICSKHQQKSRSHWRMNILSELNAIFGTVVIVGILWPRGCGLLKMQTNLLRGLWSHKGIRGCYFILGAKNILPYLLG